MYERFSILTPKGLIDGFRKQLIYNRINMEARKFVGFLIAYGTALGIGIGLDLYLFWGTNPVIGFLGGLLGIISIAYIILKMKSESDGKFVETILPDALQLIASNMKSGLTTERSLFVAGRPEFGPLALELKNASKRISSGEKADVALNGISDGINSTTLRKTLWLISKGIKSGGQMANLLFQLSDDLKSQQALESEISANISIYILLILFASLFGAPVLFGISSFIVQVLTKQMSLTPDINPESMGGANSSMISGFAGGESAITPEFILDFSVVTLFLATLFSSITIGVINTGKEIGGVKYILPLLIVAFLVFFASRVGLTLVFGNLL